MKTFEEIPQEIERLGHLYAEAKAKSHVIDESKHSVLAIEAGKFTGSEAERNRRARATDEYKEYLGKVQLAKQTELEYKYSLDALQAQFAYYQAQNANERARINLK